MVTTAHSFDLLKKPERSDTVTLPSTTPAEACVVGRPISPCVLRLPVKSAASIDEKGAVNGRTLRRTNHTAQILRTIRCQENMAVEGTRQCARRLIAQDFIGRRRVQAATRVALL